jgi:predicted nucleic acid-binding protein
VIVIDTSAFTKFLMQEKNWQDIIQYLEPKAQPYTVEMLFTESTNVIWKYVKKTLISKEEGFEFFEDLKLMYDAQTITTEKNMIYGDLALSIGFAQDIPIYDSLFIAQAQHHRVSLITCDKKQAGIADKMNIPVEIV